MDRAFVDTSAWLTYANRRARDAPDVARVLEEYAGRIVTTNYVFDEAVTLARFRFGHATATTAGRLMRNQKIADLVRVTAQDERNAWRLFLDRVDKEYSFTDCTSFVVMRRLGLAVAVALDADFRREGFRVLP